MIPNTVSVTAYFVTGEVNNVLENASPKDAIENYFLPDMRPPVENLLIEAFDKDGKKVTISITQKSINVYTD